MIHKIKIPEELWAELIILASRDMLHLEGNILKVLDTEGRPTYQAYVDRAIAIDKEKREKRISITKQVQTQNLELNRTRQELENALAESREAQRQAEDAKYKAEKAVDVVKKDLDYMQKATQNEMISMIIRVLMWVIVMVGATTTLLYACALFFFHVSASDMTLLASTWSNMFGILLTNAFSIIGTIMGVKYIISPNRGVPNGRSPTQEDQN